MEQFLCQKLISPSTLLRGWPQHNSSKDPQKMICFSNRPVPWIEPLTSACEVHEVKLTSPLSQDTNLLHCASFPLPRVRPYGLLIFSITNSWWICNEIIVADVGEFRYFKRYTCKDGKDGKENSMGGMVAETCWPQDKVWMSKTIKNINIYKSTDGLVPLYGCEIIKPTTKCICKTSQEVW